MSYGLGIVAHVDRYGTAEELKTQLETDHRCAFMSVDTGHLGPGTNHRIVWSVLSDLDSDWSVVLEDDALPVPEFLGQLDNVLLASPTDIVCLYLGRLRPPQYQAKISDALEKADANDAHWIISDRCLNAVAVAIKTSLIPDMLANLPVIPIDQAITKWARKRGHRTGYPVPSLVDHADTPTLIKHPDGKPRVPGRVAWRTGTRDTWTSASVSL